MFVTYYLTNTYRISILISRKLALDCKHFLGLDKRLNLYNNREKDYKKIIVPHIAQTIKGTMNDDSDEDTGWVLEVAIRFSDYPDISNGKTPKDGDMWRIGLHRCGGKINEQFSQWSPSKTPSPNFHRPHDFGNVFFSKKAVVIEK